MSTALKCRPVQRAAYRECSPSATVSHPRRMFRPIFQRMSPKTSARPNQLLLLLLIGARCVSCRRVMQESLWCHEDINASARHRSDVDVHCVEAPSTCSYIAAFLSRREVELVFTVNTSCASVPKHSRELVISCSRVANSRKNASPLYDSRRRKAGNVTNS